MLLYNHSLATLYDFKHLDMIGKLHKSELRIFLHIVAVSLQHVQTVLNLMVFI